MLYLVLFPYIHLESDSPPAGSFYLLGYFVRSLRIQIGNNNLCFFLCETQTNTATDAGSTAGDDGYLVLQSHDNPPESIVK